MNKREQIDYILDNLDIGLHEYYNYSLRLDEYWRVHGLDDFAAFIGWCNATGQVDLITSTITLDLDNVNGQPRTRGSTRLFPVKG